MLKTSDSQHRSNHRRASQNRSFVKRLVEHSLIHKVKFSDYRQQVRDVYDGPRGALLHTASVLSLHLPLSERLLSQKRFDLRGVQRMLDVGSGAGQLAQHMVKYSDPGTEVFCFDLSQEMLRRNRARLQDRINSKGDPAYFTAGDLSQIPFADNTFDAISCGYVLEYMPDAITGLREMARVLVPGGRIMLLATEDTLAEAFTSRLWCCRTYTRKELRESCQELGLKWNKDLWFTNMHRRFNAGGICVELKKVG